jgi:hypothetical protein
MILAIYFGDVLAFILRNGRVIMLYFACIQQASRSQVYDMWIFKCFCEVKKENCVWRPRQSAVCPHLISATRPFVEFS